MWVLILEKAWAKLHGCYYLIEAGMTKESLHDLTGAPALTLFTGEKESQYLWEQILDGEKCVIKKLKKLLFLYILKNYIMTAGTNGEGKIINLK